MSHPFRFDGRDYKTLHAPSYKFHIRYLVGVPDEWQGHSGDILIVNPENNNELIFAGLTPSGIVVQEKTRIDGLEPAGYLADLIDNDTIVIIGSQNNKRIAVSTDFIKKIGGHFTGDLTFEPGVTIDGIDLSEIYNIFFNKNNLMYPEVINGQVIFNGYVTFNGGTNLGSGGDGVNQFKLLTDTPSSYTGHSGKVVTVNDDESGLEFKTLSGVVINYNAEFFTLTSDQVSSKSVELSETPANVQTLIIHVAGGLPGVYGVDFIVTGTTVSWDGLEWDGILTQDDKISICYPY